MTPILVAAQELRRLATIRFPGFDKDEGADSDIEVYSESGSEQDGLNMGDGEHTSTG